jgi:hypothetical protein
MFRLGVVAPEARLSLWKTPEKGNTFFDDIVNLLWGN